MAALIAGVNAVVDKSSPASEIFDSIRLAARGESTIHPSQPALMDIASELDADQLPIFGMRIDRTPLPAICETLRITPEQLAQRLDGLLQRIEARLEIAAAADDRPPG